ncbi:MAG: hypothetical protein QM731_08110 [Chitinophagaceae bacterium]
MQLAQLNILAVGRNEEIMQVLNRLLNTPAKWKGTTVTTDEEAIEICSTDPYHMVLLCAGITEAEERQLKERLLQVSPAMIFIRHQGGGSGLLTGEILAALDYHGISISQE